MHEAQSLCLPKTVGQGKCLKLFINKDASKFKDQNPSNNSEKWSSIDIQCLVSRDIKLFTQGEKFVVMQYSMQPAATRLLIKFAKLRTGYQIIE